ncbi:MAG: hypothetical protein M3Y13_07120, partial [Armatimonadota bacterium]|nr:hypothetical protein [Armatimonadota bacterium]
PSLSARLLSPDGTVVAETDPATGQSKLPEVSPLPVKPPSYTTLLLELTLSPQSAATGMETNVDVQTASGHDLFVPVHIKVAP